MCGLEFINPPTTHTCELEFAASRKFEAADVDIRARATESLRGESVPDPPVRLLLSNVKTWVLSDAEPGE